MSTSKRPRTPAQQAASRQNGAKSRGPVTEIGKQRSRMNAFQHGLCAQSVLLPDEDESECQLLMEEYGQHYRHVTALELARVHEMALCDWRLRRLTVMEQGLFTLALREDVKDEARRQRLFNTQPDERDEAETLAHAFRYQLAGSASLPLLLRYQAQLQRTQERARKALKQLQAERQQQEREQQAMTPNEPKPVTPIRPQPPAHPAPQPVPAVTPNEPELTPAPIPSHLPNEPKRKLIQAQEDRTQPRQ